MAAIAGGQALPTPGEGGQRAILISAGSLPELLSSDDYPVDALRAGEHGITSVSLSIDSLGRVARCDIIASSGSASLDKTTCSVFQTRARYRPARDANDRPTTDQVPVKIRWAIPPIFMGEGYTRATFDLSSGAQAGRCTSESNLKIKFDCSTLDSVRQNIMSWPDIPQAEALVLEWGQRIGTGDMLANIGRGPGQRRLGIDAIMVTIDAAGKVANCQPATADSNTDAVKRMCGNAKSELYPPLAADAPREPQRILTRYSGSYLTGAAKPPRLLNLSELFRPDDYPADALASAKEGVAIAKVVVSAEGRATACRIVASTGTASLDGTTCSGFLARGKFEPGRDPHDRPQQAELTQRVRWLLPVQPVQDNYTRAILTLGRDGAVLACTVEGENNGLFTCDDAKDRGRLAVKSDEAKGKKALVTEIGEMVGSGESVAQIGTGEGVTHWFLSAVTLAIDAAGKVTDCRPLPDWPENEFTKRSCAQFIKDKFVPLALSDPNRSPRYLTRYEATYFRD